ncbi:hypothetical protein D3C79_1045090 [compost metagenome]
MHYTIILRSIFASVLFSDIQRIHIGAQDYCLSRLVPLKNPGQTEAGTAPFDFNPEFR